MRPSLAAVLLFLALMAASVPTIQAEPGQVTPPPDALIAPKGSGPAAIKETLALPGATWPNDRNGDKVFDSLMARFARAPLASQPVIVTFVQGVDPDAALADIEAVAGPFHVRHHYRAYGGLAAELTLAQVQAIASLSGVRQVEWSQPGEAELDSATMKFGVRAVQEHLGFNGSLGVSASAPAAPTGAGVVIAILDTGFDGTHVDLAGKFLHFIDWSAKGAEVAAYDSGYHGTHVASIAGGLGVGDAKYRGVAPGASFVGFRISSDDTKASAIASMDWILAHPEVGVRVSTISFGFGTTADGTDALELAMDKAWEAGVVTFKSNGNSGPEAGTTTIPGGARGILSIGNMFDDGEGGARLSTSSSRGPTADGRHKPDLAAPGSLIMAAANGTKDGYRPLSGTSMASPFAAGTAALMISADPSLQPEDVRRILSGTALPWGPGGVDSEFGAGRLDALRAVQQVLVERALREAWPYARLAAFNVTAQTMAAHASGELTPAARTGTFEVKVAGMPLAITVIHNGSRVEAQSPTGAVLGARAIIVQVRDSTQAVVGNVSQSPGVRQHVFLSAAPTVGTYTIEVRGLVGEEALVYDVSGALPADAPASIIPDEATYVALLGDAGQNASEKGAPGPAFMLLTLAILAIAALVRRR